VWDGVPIWPKGQEVTDGQAEGLQQASGFACAPLFVRKALPQSEAWAMN